MTVEQRQHWSYDYFVALYDLSEGGTGQRPASGAIAERAGIPQNEIMALSQFMNGDRTAEMKTTGGLAGAIAITNRGIRRAEEIIASMEEAGEPASLGWWY